MTTNSNTTVIPLFSAREVNADLDFIAPIKRVLDSYHYVLGQEVTLFEKEFADYCGVSECVSVANGTDALLLALRALSIDEGDQIALVANAGFYGSTAVYASKAVPLYIDIDNDTMTMSVESLKAALFVEKPKAVIVTHLYGQLANIEEIVSLCAAQNIPVIEDCAQSHGARRNDKRCGSFGTIGCFSFYPTKNLGALGDGGAVTTNSAEISNKLRQLRQYGWGKKYSVDIQNGCNSRLDEMQAAILRDKLVSLEVENEKRRYIANCYNNAFAAINDKFICPVSVDKDYVAHLYVIRTENRDELKEHLKEKGITTDIHYPIADHMQSAYPISQSLPVSEKSCSQVLSLPCFPGLKQTQIDHVIQAVLSYFSERKI